MTTALCVVDMQTSFRAHESCLDAVLDEIRLAKRRKAPIVVLEYCQEEPTHPKIRKSLRRYRNVKYETKYDDDGSREFLQAIKDFKVKNVRVVGVNACYCVYDTACGIDGAGLNVHIPEDAIACECGYARINGNSKKCAAYEKFNGANR